MWNMGTWLMTHEQWGCNQGCSQDKSGTSKKFCIGNSGANVGEKNMDFTSMKWRKTIGLHQQKLSEVFSNQPWQFFSKRMGDFIIIGAKKTNLAADLAPGNPGSSEDSEGHPPDLGRAQGTALSVAGYLSLRLPGGWDGIWDDVPGGW